MNIKHRIRKRREALNELENLCSSSGNLLIIHYSCESFYDIPEGRTPRITSIAVRYYKTAQTKSFSIHKIAEKDKIPFEEIQEKYDAIERKMLDEYFEFVKLHKEYNWVHWNMRDINYGFEAIEYRYSVLGGEPISINNSNKFDLARKLIDMYGPKYVSHPRLEKLIEENHITKQNYLTGKEEAECFEKKEFVKLHQSTLRKVDVFHSIIERVLNDELKTNAKLKDIYGLSPQGIFQLIQDNWIASLIGAIILSLIGAYFGDFF